MTDPRGNGKNDVALEDLSRAELLERVLELEERVDRLEDPSYLKALVRQVLAEDEEQRQAELEASILPIQRIVRFDESMAQEQLTPNQRRARYLWQNYREFSHGVKDGRVVKGGELRRILQAREAEDSKIRSSTVGRVMEIIVDLTNEIATVSKADDGERRLFVPNDWLTRAESRGDS